jgi:hypothetical protein
MTIARMHSESTGEMAVSPSMLRADSRRPHFQPIRSDEPPMRKMGSTNPMRRWCVDGTRCVGAES